MPVTLLLAFAFAAPLDFAPLFAAPTAAPLPDRVLVFHQEACPPCKMLLSRLPLLRREGVTIGVGPECQVQLVDVLNDPRGYTRRCRVRATPAIALIRSGRWSRTQTDARITLDDVRGYLRLAGALP